MKFLIKLFKRKWRYERNVNNITLTIISIGRALSEKEISEIMEMLKENVECHMSGYVLVSRIFKYFGEDAIWVRAQNQQLRKVWRVQIKWQ